MLQVLQIIGVQWPTENITVIMVTYPLFYWHVIWTTKQMSLKFSKYFAQITSETREK